MIDTNSQVEYINEVLNSKISGEKFPSKKIMGVAEFILTYEEDKAKRLPAVRTENDFEAAQYDDEYDFMCFHKIRTSQVIPNLKEKAFGNADLSANSTRLTNLSMIVFLNTESVKATQEQLANSIMAIFPESLPKDQLIQGVSAVKYGIVGFDFETINIFRREYDGLEYDLKNDVVMIEVKYKIECSYTKACINNCLI